MLTHCLSSNSLAGLNVPALAAGVPAAGVTLQVTPLGSFVVAATEEVVAFAIAARAIGRLTETAGPDDDDEELDDVDDEVDDDELDIEEEDEDEGGESPFEPPLPQAGRSAVHASMPAMIIGARSRSTLRSAFAEKVSGGFGAAALGFECGLGGAERASSRILGDLQRHSVFRQPSGAPGRRLGLISNRHARAIACGAPFAGHELGKACKNGSRVGGASRSLARRIATCPRDFDALDEDDRAMVEEPERLLSVPRIPRPSRPE